LSSANPRDPWFFAQVFFEEEDMAKSKKRAVVTLQKEIKRRTTKMRRAMRKATPSQKKRLRVAMKRLDAAARAISTLYDAKSCLGFDDSNCIFSD